MGSKKITVASSSDRQNWENLFNTCVMMIQTQKIQLQSVVNERKFLEDRIKTQSAHWGSHVRVLEDQISQMKSEIMMGKLQRSIEAAESDLRMSFKERESSMYKLKLDHAEGEIEHVKVLVDCLVQNCSDPKDLSEAMSSGENGVKGSVRRSTRNSKGDAQRSKALEIEIKSLKQEYEKLSLQKSAEVFSLLLEKDFVWNQLKTMENDYGNKIKSKDVEIDQMSEKIEKLLAGMEQLQSLNHEKDDTLVTLKTKLAEMEAETKSKGSEISRLSKELELSQKSRSASVTPIFKRCTRNSVGMGGNNNGSDRSNVFVKKELPASLFSDQAKNNGQEAGSLRRKKIDVINIPDTPKLFSASFKVPKLKNKSPLVR